MDIATYMKDQLGTPVPADKIEIRTGTVRHLNKMGPLTMKDQLGGPVPDDKITVFAPDLNVADPSKVYILFRKNLFTQVFRNKIDAHQDAVRRSEEDGDSLDDFHVEGRRVVPDSGLRT